MQYCRHVYDPSPYKVLPVCIIVIKPKTNRVFRTDAAVFHIEEVTLTKATYLSNIYYHRKYQEPSLSTANVIPNLYVRTAP